MHLQCERALLGNAGALKKQGIAGDSLADIGGVHFSLGGLNSALDVPTGSSAAAFVAVKLK